AVLQEEVESRSSTEPGQRRYIEREDYSLRDAYKLTRQRRHDRFCLFLLLFTLFPRLQTHKDRAIVRLVGARDHPIAGYGLICLHRLDFRYDLFHLLQYHARSLDGRPGRKLDADAQDSLVLIRDEPGWDFPSQKNYTHHHYSNDHDRHDRLVHED